MKNTIPSFSTKRNNLVIYSFFAISFTLFLTYVDEGNNNFEWMTSPLEWVSFIVYFSGILFGQILLEKKILKRYSGKGKVLISTFGGILVGIPIVFGFFAITYFLGQIFY